MLPDYSYQKKLIREAYASLFSSNKVVLAACPGSGKTHMGSAVIKRFLADNPKTKVLIFTHAQILLREQWQEAMDSEYGVIRKGHEANETIRDNRITLTIPQTLRSVVNKLETVDLVVVDEAHQRFFSREMELILKNLKPKYFLLLTGTPSVFIGRKDFKVIGITIEDLLPTGAITDPLIEIVKTQYNYSYRSFDNRSNSPSTLLFTKKETDTTLRSLLPQILAKLTSQHRQDPSSYVWASRVDNWLDLAAKLQKTMIICNHQKQAKDVGAFLEKNKVKCLVSISERGDGIGDIEIFKKDKSIPVLIVVFRGTLGFNYTELMNVIDLSGTLNVNRIFQALCRVVRPNPASQEKKLYLKATNDEMAALTYYVMSYVVALATKKHYFAYSTDYKIAEVKVPSTYVEILQTAKDSKNKPKVEDLPRLFTFSDITDGDGDGDGDGDARTIAYTTFSNVIQRVYSDREVYTKDSLRAAVHGSKNTEEAIAKVPSLYYWLDQLGIREQLKEWIPNLQVRSTSFSDEQIVTAAKECFSLTDFHNRYRGMETWAKANGKMRLIQKNLKPGRYTELCLTALLADAKYKILQSGEIFKDGKKVKFVKRPNGFSYLYYRNAFLPVGKIIWTKFKGPIVGRKTVRYSGVPALQNLYLTTSRSKK